MAGQLITTIKKPRRPSVPHVAHVADQVIHVGVRTACGRIMIDGTHREADTDQPECGQCLELRGFSGTDRKRFTRPTFPEKPGRRSSR